MPRDDTQAMDLNEFAARAAEAAGMIKALANEKRLMILCRLLEAGEMNVTGLADAVGLSQSALSQHLAKMRAEGLVAHRRTAQTLHYRVDDPDVVRIIGVFQDVFCNPHSKGPKQK
jgi:ArsR family transcriptional regulator, virulence genes transcriptional regulator